MALMSPPLSRPRTAFISDFGTFELIRKPCHPTYQGQSLDRRQVWRIGAFGCPLLKSCGGLVSFDRTSRRCDLFFTRCAPQNINSGAYLHRWPGRSFAAPSARVSPRRSAAAFFSPPFCVYRSSACRCCRIVCLTKPAAVLRLLLEASPRVQPRLLLPFQYWNAANHEGSFDLHNHRRPVPHKSLQRFAQRCPSAARCASASSHRHWFFFSGDVRFNDFYAPGHFCGS